MGQQEALSSSNHVPPLPLAALLCPPQDPQLLLELYEAMGQQEAAAELHLQAALELAAGALGTAGMAGMGLEGGQHWSRRRVSSACWVWDGP